MLFTMEEDETQRCEMNDDLGPYLELRPFRVCRLPGPSPVVGVSSRELEVEECERHVLSPVTTGQILWDRVRPRVLSVSVGHHF